MGARSILNDAPGHKNTVPRQGSCFGQEQSSFLTCRAYVAPTPWLRRARGETHLHELQTPNVPQLPSCVPQKTSGLWAWPPVSRRWWSPTFMGMWRASSSPRGAGLQVRTEGGCSGRGWCCPHRLEQQILPQRHPAAHLTCWTSISSVTIIQLGVGSSFSHAN